MRRREKTRRGTVENWIEQLPYIILTGVTLILIYVLIDMLIKTGVDVKPIQAEVGFYRILYSPNAITYQDNLTGAVYPGVIDLLKFNDTTIDALMKYSYEKQLCARFRIMKMQNGKWVLEKEAYFSKVWFERLEPLASAGIIGLGSAQKFTKIMPIDYIKDGSLMQGFLQADFILPRS
ncbi:MAG: hypothetical protein V1866_03140 [archaeon]